MKLDIFHELRKFRFCREEGKKEMKRKLCSLLIAAMMIGSSLTAFAADAVVPKDVAGTVYEQAVKTLMEKNVVAGYADGTYRPAIGIARGEACTMIVKYLAPTEEALKQAKQSMFTDMKDHWAINYVNYAVDKGIAKGYENNTFQPEAMVTYDEMATMLVNAMGAGKDLTGTWPENYVNKAKELGILADVNVANTGEKSCNRGDVALMICSADKYKAKDSATAAAKALVAEADKKTQSAKSMSYSLTTDMVISVLNQKLATTMTGNVDMIMDPVSMKMNIKMDMGALGSQEMETYMVSENGVLMMYNLTDGKWTKQAAGNADAMVEYNAKENMDLYLTSYESVRLEGKDTVNGKTATKLYCKLADEYIEKALGMASMEEQLEGTGISASMLTDMYKGVKGFSYSIWIDDATGMVVKYDMDMTEVMAQVMKNMIDIVGKEDPTAAAAIKGMSYDKMTMNMTVTGVDNVKTIVLPDAAKNAPVVTVPAITQ